ncbi:chloride channel protein [Cyanobium sp. T1B-Tous]|nr:chloride channel protein [Cyanobium sp. T1B-Tous]
MLAVASALSMPTVVFWLLLGLGMGALQWPYQAISELGFQVQRRLWSLAGLTTGPVPAGWGPLLVFGASAALLLLAWGPLAAGRGGGVAPILALDRTPLPPAAAEHEPWLAKLSLRSQLQRLPLMVLTHVGGLAVGVESPAVALGASVLLAIRRRWPGFGPLGQLPIRLVAVIGGAAGLGAAFRSPLLAVAYGLEELGRRSGISLLLPTLLLAGSGTLVSTGLGQPARLAGVQFGGLAVSLWGWAALFTLVGAGLGSLLVRVLVPLAGGVQRLMERQRWAGSLLLAAVLTLVALASGGLSLNDGSLSLGAALAGESGGTLLALLWRWLATLISLAAGAPGGLMHDTMTLGALMTAPLQSLGSLDAVALGQLAAIGATALFAGAHGTPLFCGAFVFTLQGDPKLLPALLLVSATSAAISQRWRGEGWNDHQCGALLSPP